MTWAYQEPSDSVQRRARRAFLCRAAAYGALTIHAAAAFADEAAGTFGFTAKVDADGFLNPILKSVAIEKLEAGKPAQIAGLALGDVIVEVEGRPVAGARAKEMAALMKRRPGEKVELKLARQDGTTYSVKLVAVARK